MALFTHEGKITFSVSNKCNIDCSYCYTNKESHKLEVLDLDFAKVAIDDFFASSNSRRLRFFGSGEPTVRIDRIKEIYNYASKESGTIPIEAEIQTNGVYSKSVSEWLSHKMSIIYFSTDGPYWVQDKIRATSTGKGTAKTVKASIEHTVKIAGAKVCVRTTISKYNLARQRELIDYFRDLGVSNIWTRPIFPPPVGVRKGIEDSVSMRDYTTHFLDARMYAEQQGVFYGSFLHCNFDDNIDGYCSAVRPSPLLTTDGYVSSCDNVLFGNNIGSFEQFIIGKWIRDKHQIEYYPDRIKALQARVVSNMPGCSSCHVQNHCGGYCPAEILEATGTIYGKKPEVCEATSKLSESIPMNSDAYECRHP